MRGLLAAIAAAALAFVQANDVWPMPPTFQQGSSTTFVDPSFRISCAAASPVCPDPLSAAFTRYQNMVFWAGQPVPLTGTNKITGLQVIVGSEATLALGVDESYNLTVPVTGVAQITSNTQWGALRGLETFAQLTAWAGNGAPTAYAIDSAPVKIADAPRFQWRGTVSQRYPPRRTTAILCATTDNIQRSVFLCRHPFPPDICTCTAAAADRHVPPLPGRGHHPGHAGRHVLQQDERHALVSAMYAARCCTVRYC